MEDSNNFYAYFPGGFHRPEIYEEDEEVPERVIKLVSDLDRLIEQHGFDLGEFEREKRLWFSEIPRELSETDPVAAEKLAKESKVHCQNVQKMIYPLYLEMLRLGYSREELV